MADKASLEKHMTEALGKYGIQLRSVKTDISNSQIEVRIKELEVAAATKKAAEESARRRS